MSFLHGLLHDKTANTLAIAAAAMIPLMAMVGGGIDASRYYMASARMQAACDAGALAARRAMPTNAFTTEHRTIGLNFFDQNFNDGIFGVTNRVRNYTSSGNGVVVGTASGKLPSTIMGAFGYTEFNLSASCTAEVNISNTDIMFVLDVTGSMADCPATSGCNSGPGSKIVALRSAVMSFYDTVQAATSPAAQVRYGIVPYAQQVNVGFSIPRAHLANNHRYQSRVARFTPAAFPNNNAGDVIVLSDQTEWLPRSTSNFNSSTTDHYRFRTDGSAGTTAQSVCANYANTYTVNVSGVNQSWQVFATPQFVTNQWSGGDSWNRAGCRARVRKTRTLTTTDVNPQFQDWLYCQVQTGISNPCGVSNPARSPAGWEAVNFSTVYSGSNTVSMPIGTNGAMTSVSWAGCVEEPETVLTDNYSPIPANAHDLNINLVPTNDAQRWKPALQNAVWRRASDANTVSTGDLNRGGFACPRAARKMGTITRTDLQNYVNSLTASGQTYHDIGMVWGARFISPRGIFAAENSTAPNGDPIARHIVFMTDGEQVNTNTNYSTHGVEITDRRITGDGNGTREFNRRAARLQAICRAAQQENITVWVVAFGTTLTQNLIDCASPGRAFQANDNATLNARFQEIAQKIAALRLTS
ncbi:MAG: VWA domain-containing protein [Porphyrobacter sp.]|nr:VWA domain-containing protein [Porphyrobacter sp.]